MIHAKKNFDQNFFNQNKFRPKYFFTQNNSDPKKIYDQILFDPNFFDPIFFFGQTNVDKKMLTQKNVDPNFFNSKKFPTLIFFPKIISDPNFF